MIWIWLRGFLIEIISEIVGDINGRIALLEVKLELLYNIPSFDCVDCVRKSSQLSSDFSCKIGKGLELRRLYAN
jgi:hypothetical protein